MLTFKQFLAEMQAINDNPEDENIKRAYNDSMREVRRPYDINDKKAIANRNFHMAKIKTLRVSNPHLNLTPVNESNKMRSVAAALMLAATSAQAGGMAHELPVHSYEEIQSPNAPREMVEKSRQALEKAQDEYDESMPGQHLSDAIDAHNNGDIKAAIGHLGIHNKMINKRQSSPMS